MVKLGSSSMKVFQEGVLTRDGPKKTLSKWMDCPKDSLSLVEDQNAAKLFECDGSYMEKKKEPFVARY